MWSCSFGKFSLNQKMFEVYRNRLLPTRLHQGRFVVGANRLLPMRLHQGSVCEQAVTHVPASRE